MMGSFRDGRFKRPSAIARKKLGCQGDDRDRKPRRNIIEDIVNPRGCFPEKQVAFIFIAHHGIQCIDHLIGHRQRRPAQRCEEQRRNHTIHQILGHRFNSRARDSVFPVMGHITADDQAHLFSSGLYISLLKTAADVHGGIF